MAYKLGNNLLSDYGFKAGRQKGSTVAVGGFMDMPRRMGSTYHEWGEGIEPFVESSDFRFGGRDLEFFALIAEDDLEGGVAFLNDFYEIIQGFTTLVTFETPFGNYLVYISKPIEVEHYKDGIFEIRVTFREPVVFLPSPVIPSPSNYGVPGVDGIPFSLFGFSILVRRVVGNYGMSGAGKMYFENYDNEGYQLTNPGIKKIEVEILCLSDSFNNLQIQIDLFHAILAGPGIRNFNLDGNFIVKGFVTEGFSVSNLKIGNNEVSCVLRVFVNSVFSIIYYLVNNAGEYITADNDTTKKIIV